MRKKLKRLSRWKKKFISWLFYDFLIETIAEEYDVLIRFYEKGTYIHYKTMRRVPRINESIQIRKHMRGLNEHYTIFVVEGVVHKEELNVVDVHGATIFI